MYKLNQKGAFQLVVIILLVLGIGVAVYLSQKTQIFLPKAAETTPSRLPIKIMPLGDSLTHGVKNGSTDAENLMAGYRYYLYKNLISSGLNIDMVGSLSSGPSDLAERNHQGHNGYDCTQIEAAITNSLTNYLPDYVLLLCGINEFAQPRTEEFKAQAINHLSSLIDKIALLSPNTKIIISTIAPSDIDYIPNLKANIDNFNSQIPGLISAKAAQGKKVFLVDTYNGLTLADISDHVHPNENGYQKMADIWQNALKPLITNPEAPGLVANYSYVKPGSPQAVSWFNLQNPQGASWIGLYKTGIPDNQFSQFVTWFYLGNCSGTQGTPASSSKTGGCKVSLPANLPEGTYEFKLHLQGTTFALRSNTFTVTNAGFPLVSPSPSPSMIPSPSPSASPNSAPKNVVTISPSSINPGNNLTVSWSNLSNPGPSSWMGLYSSSDPTTTHNGFKEWNYLGSCSKLNGVTPNASGSCQFTVLSGIPGGSYEIRMFLQGTTFTSKSKTFQVN